MPHDDHHIEVTEHEEHVVPVRVYVTIFTALMVLTAITVAIAYVHLGALNAVVALTVAVTKATLVVLYFMHVRWSTNLTRLTVVSGFFWLLILLTLTLSDYLTRGWLSMPQIQ